MTSRTNLWRFVADRFLLLPAGVLIALAWANLAAESYFTVAHASRFAVNEIAMALFLGLVAQELYEAMLPGGLLHSWRRWGLALVAAAGGAAGAAGLYLAWVNWRHELVLVQAWPVVCAIDIAAGYYVLRTVWPRTGAVPFFLLLAAATDAFGLLVVALRGPGVVADPLAFVLMAAALGLAFGFRQQKVRVFWPYLAICGGMSWWALYLAGLHPALALIPLVPWLPHWPRRHDPLADRLDALPVHQEEHRWHNVVQVVLFLFGLVNGGVLFDGYDTGTWALLAAAVVGRPAGILVAVAMARAVGFHLPQGLAWRHLAVIALATSSGFTFALFFATAALPAGQVLIEIKFGALLTAIGALAALAAGRLLGVGGSPAPEALPAVGRETSWRTS